MMKGLGVSQGIGIGRAFVVDDRNIEVEKSYVPNVIAEAKRLEDALNVCKLQIEEIYMKTLQNIGEKEAQIFKAHEMILEDETFISEVELIIKTEKVNAEYALQETATRYIEMFENMEDEYLKERAQDVRDIMSRIIKILMAVKITDFSNMDANTIVVAKDLTPSDTAQIDKYKVTAMITETGGKTSHAAIMSRTMGIPTVVGIEGITDKIKDGDLVICDGASGKVIINPGEKQKKYYLNKQEKEEQLNLSLKKQIGLPTVTLDGFKTGLVANIGTPGDIESALENDAEGVGLFRSEFLYMNRENLPTEEEQFQSYKEVLEKMGNKPVVIRTLDIGGDKELPYLKIPKEMNPFLGYRAIRLCLDNTNIFKAQLRAILRAGLYGDARIMFPMISTMKELRDAKKIYEEAKADLRNENIEFKEDMQIGVMIEIPSAAIISDLLAKEVDFFSIGTNDLIQYTMAVDRMNSKLAYLYSEYHPALLRLIKNIIKNGHKANKWVGMCGEAASDPKLIPVFIGMGLDEFSMNSPAILRARHIIRGLSKADMEKIADTVLVLDTAVEVENYLSNIFSQDELNNYLSHVCKKGTSTEKKNNISNIS